VWNTDNRNEEKGANYIEKRVIYVQNFPEVTIFKRE
jgi:hypothetical protein